MNMARCANHRQTIGQYNNLCRLLCIGAFIFKFYEGFVRVGVTLCALLKYMMRGNVRGSRYSGKALIKDREDPIS